MDFKSFSLFERENHFFLPLVLETRRSKKQHFLIKEDKAFYCLSVKMCLAGNGLSVQQTTIE